ncbi:MAG: hypothetical protein JNK21_00830 [Rhodospirillaceae bacterium]|nr:hypothetical protein [Rhodospirillaceae bacterium]
MKANLATLALAALAFLPTAVEAQDFTQQQYGFGGKSRGTSAIAYFHLPFSTKADIQRPRFGFAVTSSALRQRNSTLQLVTRDPRLVDLRFDTSGMESLRIGATPIVGRKLGATSADSGLEMSSGVMEALGLVGMVAVVAAVVAVGDQESKRLCNGRPISDNEVCNGVLTTG